MAATTNNTQLIDALADTAVAELDRYKEHMAYGRYSDAAAALVGIEKLTEQVHSIEERNARNTVLFGSADRELKNAYAIGQEIRTAAPIKEDGS